MAVLDWGHKIKRKHFFFGTTKGFITKSCTQCSVLLLAYISLCQHFHTPKTNPTRGEGTSKTEHIKVFVACCNRSNPCYHLQHGSFMHLSVLFFFFFLPARLLGKTATVWWWAHGYPVTALSLWIKHTGPSLAPHFLLRFFKRWICLIIIMYKM